LGCILLGVARKRGDWYGYAHIAGVMVLD